MNGALREFVFIQRFGVARNPANQLSCLSGAILWTAALLFLWKKLEIKNFRQSAYVGAGWVLATALFETFILNRSLSWQEIAHTYNVASGEFWGLVLIWLGLMPVIFLSVSLSKPSIPS